MPGSDFDTGSKPFGWLGAGIFLCLLCSPPASAQQPSIDVAAAPSTIYRLTLFNDNLYLGIGAVAVLIEYDKMNGNDFGYTHGMELAVERLSTSGVTGTWSLSSRLYSRREHDPVPGDTPGEVRVWFTEEEVFSYIADTRKQARVYFLEYGGGLLYDGKTLTAPGASGQQRLFHQAFHTSSQRTYRYLDDGDAAGGGFLHIGFGLQKRWRLGASVDATATVRVAAEPNTFTAASQVFQECGASLRYATRATTWSASAVVETVLHPEGIAVSPSFELAFERRGWGISSAVTLPRGDLRNHVRYNDDRDPIANLSVFIRIAR
jgi:hypothetical protein